MFGIAQVSMPLVRFSNEFLESFAIFAKTLKTQNPTISYNHGKPLTKLTLWKPKDSRIDKSAVLQNAVRCLSF
ncbi:hypothetical protein [Helicobacter enhydrae]|uniref:hypothetical protein n=1 Tax=Helicobacter enhydrae TaxID=222136 RepID=UPI001901A6A6|nr:hypothetical protein [Helicobacter enhydrae]